LIAIHRAIGPHFRSGSAMLKRALIMDTFKSLAVDHMLAMIGENSLRPCASRPKRPLERGRACADATMDLSQPRRGWQNLS
jgi:hypothetical protein